MKKSEDEKRYGTFKNDKGELEAVHKIVFENGETKLKSKLNIKKGKLARSQGSRFELKVRNHWENMNWIVDKWTNNVDLQSDKITMAKRKYNPFMRALTIGTGFPDFIALKPFNDGKHEVIGIEVKMNGTLSKEEKDKCKWYLEKGIFSKVYVAKKGSKRGEIEHIDFFDRWGK